MSPLFRRRKAYPVALAKADALRRDAALTKKEVGQYRTNAIDSKRREMAQRHLELEVAAKGTESEWGSAARARAEQAEIEAGLKVLDQLLLG